MIAVQTMNQITIIPKAWITETTENMNSYIKQNQKNTSDNSFLPKTIRYLEMCII